MNRIPEYYRKGSDDIFRRRLTAEEITPSVTRYSEKVRSVSGEFPRRFSQEYRQETQEQFMAALLMVGTYEEGTIQFTIAFNERYGARSDVLLTINFY